MIRFRFRLLLVLICLMPTLMIGASGRAHVSEEPTLAVIRGRAVCLDEAGKSVDSLFECKSKRIGFLDKAAKLYTFLKSDSAAEVFNDSRVRARELQITARLHGRDRLELIKVQSIRDDKLYDIYYYCEVCNIKEYTPGLCPCCRNEMEFRETLP
jgi:rubrerythrin